MINKAGHRTDSAAGALINRRSKSRMGRCFSESDERIATLEPSVALHKSTQPINCQRNCRSRNATITVEDLPDLQIQLQVDPGLKQNLLANTFNQS